MKKVATVYWLLPAKPERELFYEVVRILRKEFRAPSFEPHLTLFVTRRVQPSPKKVFAQVRARSLRLTTRGVAFSSKFTKTLYVRFSPSPALRKLTNDLGRTARTRAKAPSDPHVSLLYKKTSRAAKKELARVMRLPFRNVRFDCIAAVRLTLPVRTGADVEKWKIVARKSLDR